MDWDSIGCCILAFVLYMNTFNADFVYDDRRAILNNEDIWSESWINLFLNDFWGTRLIDSSSHGSYRPICVISYRLNYLISGLKPWSYHLVNIIIHCINTWLVIKVGRHLFPKKYRKQASVYTGLLFACHPIHTEAVASIVGRADLLATFFTLLSFIMYVKHVKYRDIGITTTKKHVKANFTSVTNEFLINRSSMKSKSYFSNFFNVITTCDHWYLGKTNIFLFVFINLFNILSSTINLTFNYASKKKSKHQRLQQHNRLLNRWSLLCFCIIFALLALLCKETGISALILCIIYDLTHSSFHIKNQRQKQSILLVCFGLLTILCCRFFMITNQTPKFSKSDNPISYNPSIISRFLTFSYLPVFNFYLVLCPIHLSFDWSMNSIPQINSIFDCRNLFSSIFYISIWIIFKKSLKIIFIPKFNYPKAPRPFNYNFNKKNNSSLLRFESFLVIDNNNNNNNNKKKFIDNNNPTFFPGNKMLLCSCHICQQLYKEYHYSLTPYRANHLTNNCQSMKNNTIISRSSDRRIIIFLAFLIVPFLPATNLFFYVGFVIAERILYLPSIGYCFFLSLILSKLQNKFGYLQKFLHTFCLFLLILFSTRTLIRNQDWKSEEALFRSAIHINPPKAYGNLGSILNTQKRFQEAEFAYRKALEFRPNMADVHYNLGILLHQTKKYPEAIQSFENAILYRPSLALAYVNLGATLLIQGKCQQAIKVFQKASKLDGTGLKDRKAHESAKISALVQLGTLYSQQGQLDNAIEVYKEALHISAHNYPMQIIYNRIGDIFSTMKKFDKAEQWYRAALMTKPDHISAHLTYGKLLARNESRRFEAEKWFQKAKKIAPNEPSVYYHYGEFLMSLNRFTEAVIHYIRASELKPDDFELVMTVATVLRQTDRKKEAEIWYEKAVKMNPYDARSHANFGAILHMNGKYIQAQKSYKKALQLEPNDVTTVKNLNKLQSILT